MYEIFSQKTLGKLGLTRLAGGWVFTELTYFAFQIIKHWERQETQKTVFLHQNLCRVNVKLQLKQNL